MSCRVRCTDHVAVFARIPSLVQVKDHVPELRDNLMVRILRPVIEDADGEDCSTTIAKRRACP